MENGSGITLKSFVVFEGGGQNLERTITDISKLQNCEY